MFILFPWLLKIQFSLSVVSDSGTPWTAARQASLSITNSQSSRRLVSIESVMPSNHLFLCRPLLLPPSIFPSIRVFSSVSALHIRWPKDWTKDWSFSFSISPSNEYSGVISFTIDWFDLFNNLIKDYWFHFFTYFSFLFQEPFIAAKSQHYGAI